VEDHLHPFNGPTGDSRLTQIACDELDGAVMQMLPNILGSSTTQIVDDPNPGLALDKGVNQMRADE
jgi:hypothetical protein